MSEWNIKIITRSEDLPIMEWRDFFHSPEFFSICEHSSGLSPYMVIATDSNGTMKAHMLAVLRRRGSWLPPYLFTQGRVYGEGEYADGVDKAQIFGLMLEAITRRLKRRLCLSIEFSELSSKMFGYKEFRSLGYTPVTWMEVHNSLHSKPPRERLTPNLAKRVEAIEQEGTKSFLLTGETELSSYYRTMRRFFLMKFRRYLPPEDLFRQLSHNKHGRLLVTKNNNRIIGVSACIFTKGNAYLWYMAAKRKTYAVLHPSTATIWGAINYAYEQGCRHIYFMDVGLPYNRNSLREFILRFGGKDVSGYRWFRFTLPWINRFFNWLYRE